MDKHLTDSDIETIIKERDLNLAPRIDIDRINFLMGMVEYKCYVIEGTTTTVAHAMLDGFTLAMGKSACISKVNFDKELGERMAQQNAAEDARKELWKLEGWRLKVHLTPSFRQSKRS